MPTDTSPPYKRFSAERMPAEHHTQLELLDTLVGSIKAGKQDTNTIKQLDRLVSYTGLHFLSEQLLMQDQGYTAYGEHAEDHQRILEFLRDLQTGHHERGHRLNEEDAEMIRSNIIKHISHHDQKLHSSLGQD